VAAEAAMEEKRSAYETETALPSTPGLSFHVHFTPSMMDSGVEDN
jgi:hypothetical protein